LVKNADVDARWRRAKKLNSIVEITGSMLRAARTLAGLSQQELAERVSISRHAERRC
jgi:ribosome-binding protein aMBF1 (putative translation factor)